MKRKYLQIGRWLLVWSCVCLLEACGSPKAPLATFYPFETSVMGTEYDGSITVRVWGEGSTKRDAVEQALKKAVNDVLFKGITQGVGEYQRRPLVTEVNARERHADYFNRFFADQGEYARYVNLKDEKSNSRQRMENRLIYKYAITARVLVAELENRLKQDGILPR